MKAYKLHLSADEKALLRKSDVKINQLKDYAPDEISAILHSSAQRANEICALMEFQSCPSIGPKFARDLIDMGYYSINQLKDKDGAELLNDHERLIGTKTDPCVEDQFRLIVYYANHPDSKKQWWDFTDERKAFRLQNGYPPTRP